MARKPEVDHTIHDQLALKLCAEALRYPDSSESKVYLKALLQLSMSFSNPSHTRDLHSLTRKLMRKVKDRTSVRLIEQFENVIQKHLVPASGDSAESTADETEMEIEPSTNVSEAQSSKQGPRIRRLGSKHGTTLLMEVAGSSDAEGSQNSDVFLSPPSSSSTQREKGKEKTSNEDCVIEVDFRYFGLLIT